MNKLYTGVLFALISVMLSACFFDKKHEDVDSFYTTRSFGDMPVVPLLKPLKLITPARRNMWGIEIPHAYKQRIMIDSITHVGVDAPYVYGKIFERERYVLNYAMGKYVFANKYNTIYTYSSPSEAEEDEIQLFPIDSASNVFIVPERWFVLNVADSTVEAFFSKSEYEEYLRDRQISGTMYRIDSMHQEFMETGVLPWFPDSVQVKLKAH